MKNLLAVALVVSVASIALSQAPETKSPAAERNARSRKPEDYQKCEYKVLDLGKGGVEGLEKSLNDAAKEGYELERVISDRVGIMRRNFRSDFRDRGSVQSGPTS